MKRRQGFTLIEAVLAMGIAAVCLGLITGWDRIYARALRGNGPELDLWTQVMEQRRYQFKAIRQNRLDLIDHTEKDKPLSLWVDDQHILRLTNQTGQGYVPLLKHVEQIQWRSLAQGQLVAVRLKQEGQAWRKLILDLRTSAGDS